MSGILKVILIIVTLSVSYFIGAFAWSGTIASIHCLLHFRPKHCFFEEDRKATVKANRALLPAIIIWSIVLCGCAAITYYWLKDFWIPITIGFAISLFATFGALSSARHEHQMKIFNYAAEQTHDNPNAFKEN